LVKFAIAIQCLLNITSNGGVMKQKRVALYVRVSTGEQNTEAQERALREYVKRRGWLIYKIYRDQGISGASTNPPARNELLRDCRRGSFSVLAVFKFDRFARSLSALISGLEICRSFGIDFVSVTEAVDTSLPHGTLLFQLLGAVAELERSLIGERVRAGLANAKAKGKVLGRPPLRLLTSGEVKQLRRERREKGVPYRELAAAWNISVWTAHRLCQEPKGAKC
jgi:DNA invertase Pin-like site-specific DNA recombinase